LIIWTFWQRIFALSLCRVTFLHWFTLKYILNFFPKYYICKDIGIGSHYFWGRTRGKYVAIFLPWVASTNDALFRFMFALSVKHTLLDIWGKSEIGLLLNKTPGHTTVALPPQNKHANIIFLSKLHTLHLFGLTQHTLILIQFYNWPNLLNENHDLHLRNTTWGGHRRYCYRSTGKVVTVMLLHSQNIY
jgi:hypothetical protein